MFLEIFMSKKKHKFSNVQAAERLCEVNIYAG